MLRLLRHLWRNLAGRTRFERDMSEEMRLHLDLHEESLRQHGSSPADARWRARAEFGNITAAKDACRDATGIGRFDLCVQDARVALRRLRASPAFAATAVASLALGFGANAVIFSALNGLLLKPLPFDASHELAWVFSVAAAQPDVPRTVAADDVTAIAERGSFDSLAVIDDTTLVWERPERFQLWKGLSVTRSLADVLRIRPAAGQFPRDEELAAMGPAIAISEERWRRDFGADGAVIGRRLQFADNKSFVVVAVLPARLEFPLRRAPLGGTGSGFEPGVQDFWILNGVRAASWPGGLVLSRLSRGADARSAALDISTLAPDRSRPDGESRTLRVVPMRDQVLGLLKPVLPILQAFALVVLMAACANLANLMLARAITYRADAAVRLALGASTHHLSRLAFVESLLVCALGATAGLAVAVGGPRLLMTLMPPAAPVVRTIAPDAATLLVLLSLCLAATVFFTVLPGVVRSKLPGVVLLRESSRDAAPAPSRLLRGLVAAQLSMSLVLLTGAAALQGSLTRLIHVDSGYRTSHVLTADVLLYIPQSQRVLQNVYGRLRTLPGVEALGVIHSTPLTGKWSVRDSIEIIDANGRHTTAPMTGSFVGFDYFGAMGIDLVAGRYFSDAEALMPDSPAVIINDLAARAYFPGGRAVGARLFMYGSYRQVVGIVRATRDIRPDAPPEPQWYQPMFFDGSQIVMRVSGDPRQYVERVTRALLDADSRLIVNSVAPLDDIVADRVMESRMAALLTSCFAVLALGLAGLGLAGVLHFTASRRWRELGLRVALGATRRSLMWLVTREAAATIAIGVAAGVPLMRATVWILQPLLFQGPAIEPHVIATIVMTLLMVSAVACVIPAWRAARVDPMVALRKV
jgi:putative ABC transport system permease protein